MVADSTKKGFYEARHIAGFRCFAWLTAAQAHLAIDSLDKTRVDVFEDRDGEMTIDNVRLVDLEVIRQV